MRKCKGRHDSLVKIIADELKTKGWKVNTNVEYNNFVCGEVDVDAYKKGYYLDVEVKSRDCDKTRKKAREQLLRAEKHYYPTNARVFKMYAYYTSNLKDYKLELIR